MKLAALLACAFALGFALPAGVAETCTRSETFGYGELGIGTYRGQCHSPGWRGAFFQVGQDGRGVHVEDVRVFGMTVVPEQDVPGPQVAILEVPEIGIYWEGLSVGDGALGTDQEIAGCGHADPTAGTVVDSYGVYVVACSWPVNLLL